MEVTIREQRRLYENAISVLSSALKITECKVPGIKITGEKQIERCTDMIITILDYSEVVVKKEDSKEHILVPKSGADDFKMKKSQFEKIVRNLPQNKEIRESVWQVAVKKDLKAKELLSDLFV